MYAHANILVFNMQGMILSFDPLISSHSLKKPPKLQPKN